MYEFFIALEVTSDEHPCSSMEEFVIEFDDAEDDEEAICEADSLLDQFLGTWGVESLISDGLHHPIVEGYTRADLYYDHRKVADLVTGLFDLGETPSLVHKYAGRSLPSHINEILGEPKYG